MSVKKLFLILPVFAALIYISFNYFNGKKTRGDHPKVLLSEYTGSYGSQRIIQVDLSANSISKNDMTPTKIKAEVRMPFDFDDSIEFKWIFSENVKLKKGFISGKLSKFKANQIQTLEIEVTGFTELENQQVVFQARGIKDGRQLFADSIIASQPESTFENTVQNVEKIRAENE